MRLLVWSTLESTHQDEAERVNVPPPAKESLGLEEDGPTRKKEFKQVEEENHKALEVSGIGGNSMPPERRATSFA